MRLAANPCPRLASLFALTLAGFIAVPVAEADEDSDEPIPEVERIVVQARRGGLLADTASAATKTNTPIELVPQNITVVTQTRMTLLNSRSLSEAVRYAAGVSDYGGKDDGRGFFGTIRGFSPDTYLDGTRTTNGSTNASWAIEPFGLEELDILRGTSGALYGSGQLGGIINAVSKRPRDKLRQELDIQTGSYGRIQGAADIGGALDTSRTWLWRLNGLARKSDTYARNMLSNEIYVAPSLRWRPTRQTDITLLTNYEQFDGGSVAQFLPAVGTVLDNPYGSLPRGFLGGDKDYDVYSKRQASIGYAASHRLTSNWTLSQNMRFAHLDVLNRAATARSLMDDDRTLVRRANTQTGNYNTVTLDTRSDLVLTIGSVRQQILAGVDYRHDFAAERSAQRAAPTLDIFDPVYRAITWPVPGSTTNTNETSDQTGLYLQDQIGWRGFLLTLSGREDFTSSLTVNNRTGARTPQSDNATSGRLGLMYRTSFGLNPYIAYATSFQPQIGTTRLSAPFVPTTGTQIEAGLKYRPPFGDLLLTADVFHLVEQNVLTTDPADSNYSIQTGEQRTRGLELEAVGTLPYDMKIVAAFTVQDPRITKTTVDAERGQRPTAIPDHMASAFVEKGFTLSHGIKGGIGGGVRYTGQTAGALPNDFSVPSQLVWDMEAHLTRDHMDVQVNASNLTDRKYVAVCTRITGCSYAPGRTVFVTLSYHWR